MQKWLFTAIVLVLSTSSQADLIERSFSGRGVYTLEVSGLYEYTHIFESEFHGTFQYAAFGDPTDNGFTITHSNNGYSGTTGVDKSSFCCSHPVIPTITNGSDVDALSIVLQNGCVYTFPRELMISGLYDFEYFDYMNNCLSMNILLEDYDGNALNDFVEPNYGFDIVPTSLDLSNFERNTVTYYSKFVILESFALGEIENPLLTIQLRMNGSLDSFCAVPEPSCFISLLIGISTLFAVTWAGLRRKCM